MVPLSSEALRRELLTLLAIMYRWGGRRAQAYNLSLGPSTHDQLVAVTSTRRASVTHRVTGEGPGLTHHPQILQSRDYHVRPEVVPVLHPLPHRWLAAASAAPPLARTRLAAVREL